MCSPAWADAYLGGHAEAATLKGQAEVIGDALFRTTGDAMPRDAALALSRPPLGPSRDPPRTQALGYKALDEAQRLSETQQPACTPFRKSQRLLQSGGSPYDAWTRERVVVACFYYQGNWQAALPELARLDAEGERKGYAYVRGRARWMTALFRGERGEWTAALEDLRRARDAFHTVRDPDSEAKVLALLAQGRVLVGEGREAWNERVRGLAPPRHGQERDAPHRGPRRGRARAGSKSSSVRRSTWRRRTWTSRGEEAVPRGSRTLSSHEP